MQAVVFAGGSGVKLRPLTFTTPKALLPIINQPVLAYVMTLLREAGVREVILTVDSSAEALGAYIDAHEFGMDVSIYPVEEFHGTGQILSQLKDRLAPRFWAVCADCLFDVDLREVQQFFESKSAELGVIVLPKSDQLARGFFEVDAGWLTRIVETEAEVALPDAGLVCDSWIYYMKREIITDLPADFEGEIHLDLIRWVHQKQRTIAAYESSQFWAIIGRLNSYLSTQFWVLPQIAPEGFIGAGSTVAPDAVLQTPYFIGDGCRVDSGADIGPFAILNDGVTVEAGARIDHSVILRDGSIGAGSVVVSAVIGPRCQLGSACRLGAFSVLGDKCRLGRQVQVESGSRVGPFVHIPEGQQVSGVILPGSTLSEDPALQNLPLSDVEVTAGFLIQNGSARNVGDLASALQIEPSEVIRVMTRLEELGISLG